MNIPATCNVKIAVITAIRYDTKDHVRTMTLPFHVWCLIKYCHALLDHGETNSCSSRNRALSETIKHKFTNVSSKILYYRDVTIIYLFVR